MWSLNVICCWLIIHVLSSFKSVTRRQSLGEKLYPFGGLDLIDQWLVYYSR